MIDRIKTDPQTRMMVNIVCGLIAFVAAFNYVFRYNLSDFGLYWAGAKVLPDANYIDLDRVIQVQKHFGLYVWPNPAPPYGAPPLIALVFLPVSLLSFGQARIIFGVFEFLLIGFTIYRVSPKWWGIIALIVIPSLPISSALKLGNWAAITGAFTVLAYKDMEENRISRSIVWITVAAAFKPYPFLLFVPFLFMRRYKDLLLAATIGCSMYLISAFAMGWKKFVEAMNFMLQMARETVNSDLNMGVPGVVRRFSSPGPAKIVAALALISGISLLWRYRRAEPRAQIALAALLVPLTGTLVWAMYFVAIFPVLLWFADRVGRARTIVYVSGALVFFPPAQFLMFTDWNISPLDLLWPTCICGLVILGCFIFQLEKERDLDYRNTLQASSTASK